MDDEYELRPGKLIQASDQCRIIISFREKFRTKLVDWQQPTWTIFPESTLTAPPSVLERLEVPRTEQLLILWEFPPPGQVRITSIRDAIDYFHKTTPKQSFSRNPAYLFTNSLNWCIAYTPEYWAPEDLLVLWGPVPLKALG